MLGRPCQIALQRPAFATSLAQRRGSAPRRGRNVVARASDQEVRCYVNEEGHLVCERLEPGDYLVKGAEGSQETTSTAQGDVAYCLITDDGDLVCEGLPTGNYTIERANDDQMKEILTRVEKLTSDEAPNPEPEVETGFNPETGVYCYVNADGVMVCEKLEPGDYVVKPMPKEKGPTPVASRDDVKFCYITENGELLCEGMEEGKYHIEKASDEDLSAMLSHVEKITGSKGTRLE